MSVRRPASPLAFPACTLALCLGALTEGTWAAAQDTPGTLPPAATQVAAAPQMAVAARASAVTQARLTALPPATADPWPDAPVLTRLFRLPAGRADAQQLIAALDLTVAQVRELQRLAGSETLYVQGEVTASTPAKLAVMRAEKDRKVRLLLGADYALFRQIVRDWWREQLRRAGG
ncbi:hypothetical protein ACMT4L_09680 [Deinococcus sp. A31D244]|uniref:hypothetical protein n=1 Tax=Deinococcus sp. A31D244 TaxID=3397675 RepID=UPI0039DF413A